MRIGEEIAQLALAPGASERRDDVDLGGSGVGAAIPDERLRRSRRV
jgi:hypothetical protein